MPVVVQPMGKMWLFGLYVERGLLQCLMRFKYSKTKSLVK